MSTARPSSAPAGAFAGEVPPELWEARTLIDLGDIGPAQEALASYAAAGDPSVRLAAHRLKAKCLQLAGDIRGALNVILHGRPAVEQTGDENLCLDYDRYEAVLRWLLFDTREADELVRKVESRTKTSGHPRFADALLIRGLRAEMQWRNEVAAALFARAAEVARRNEYYRRAVTARSYRARALGYHGRYDEALYEAEGCLEDVKRWGLPERGRHWYTAFTRVADALFHIEELEEARERYQEVMEWARSKGLGYVVLRTEYKLLKVAHQLDQATYGDWQAIARRYLDIGLKRHAWHFLARAAQKCPERERAVSLDLVRRILRELQGREQDAAVVVYDALCAVLALDPRPWPELPAWLDRVAAHRQPNLRPRLELARQDELLARALGLALVPKTVPTRDGGSFDLETGGITPSRAGEGARRMAAVVPLVRYLMENQHRVCWRDELRDVLARNGRPLGPNSFRQLLHQMTRLFPDGFITRPVRGGFQISR